MRKEIKSKKTNNAGIILILLLTVTFLTCNIIKATPVFASPSQEVESESNQADSDTSEDEVQDTDSDADAGEPAISKFESIAEAAILIEASTGKVLYEKMQTNHCHRQHHQGYDLAAGL